MISKKSINLMKVIFKKNQNINISKQLAKLQIVPLST